MLAIEVYLAAHHMRESLQVTHDGAVFLASIVNLDDEPLHWVQGSTLTEALTNLNDLVAKHL